MVNSWNPEIVITKDFAVQLINAQFPSLGIQTIVEFGQGFDNTIFLVNQEYIFRFPRRSIAEGLLRTEGELLPKLVDKLPLSVPRPIFYGKKSKHYPWGFIGYKHIIGKVPSMLTTTERLRMVQPLAEFLKELHKYPLKELDNLLIPYDELYRLDIEKRKPRLLEKIIELIEYENIHVYRQTEKYAQSLQAIAVPDTKVLTHGDLHIRNVIVSEANSLAGIIDWGDTHIGHPAVDLSIVFSLIPAEGRESFFSIYGHVDSTTLELARFKAIYTLVILLSYAWDKKDSVLYKDAKSSLSIALSN